MKLCFRKQEKIKLYNMEGHIFSKNTHKALINVNLDNFYE